MQWDYQSIPVRQGEKVQKWLLKYRETHALPTWDDTLAHLIECIDPNWEFLDEVEGQLH